MAERLHFKVEGMDCASCARKIETGVSRIAGISHISINTMTETLILSASSAGLAEKVESAVRELGYRPKLLNQADAVPPPVDDDNATAKSATSDHTGAAFGDHEDDDHGAPIDGRWWESGKGSSS